MNWTVKIKKEFMEVDEACKAIFGPTSFSGIILITERTFDSYEKPECLLKFDSVL